MKYKILITLSVIVTIIIILVSPKLKVHAQSSSTITITSTDISQAGYNNVSSQQPEGLNYSRASYFWVDGIADHTNLTNLLMVSVYDQGTFYTDSLFNYGVSRQPFSISGGIGEEATLSNDTRVALNFSKGNYYIVIIGPTSQKVEALARIIAAKI